MSASTNPVDAGLDKVRSAEHHSVAPRPIYVHVRGLPETPYKRLIGRASELKLLHEAWGGRRANVISLVAEGGAGKSALVNEWLKTLQTEDYHGAEIILGWSFYSQGSSERTTAADEFLIWALDKLGIELDTTNAAAKGDAIAEVMTKRRVLLVLDGVEPLQQGPGPHAGRLKDLGMSALLRRFAAMPPGETKGLIVLTTRLALTDIARWQDTAAPILDFRQLSEEAGAMLLRDNGVWGADKELKNTSREFGGHPLSLSLLAAFLKETQFGDVRRRDHIRGVLHDKDNPRHDHTKRVMESFEREWLTDKPPLLAIMHMIGLFDRPASSGCLEALRSEPVIKGLTDQIADLTDSEWQRAITLLRDVRLLTPPDPSAQESIDAHPLVREWFGERLRLANQGAWHSAHGRLYEHLRDTTMEGKTPTLKDLAPLYHAVAHACCAGLHQDALDLYQRRICRWRYLSPLLWDLEYYSRFKLGAYASDLAAISSFFAEPYVTPIAGFDASEVAWLLGEAGYLLRSQGRVYESLPPQRKSFEMDVKKHDIINLSISASNISETELTIGDVSNAVIYAERSVEYAAQGHDEFQITIAQTTHAAALIAAGQRGEAKAILVDVEARESELQMVEPRIYCQGLSHYCDLLLEDCNWVRAHERAEMAFRISRADKWPLHIANDNLALGRAHLGLALAHTAGEILDQNSLQNTEKARTLIDEAVDGLRMAAVVYLIPDGLLARAAFRRSVGDWSGAARDLDEVIEIAERGPMKLLFCDAALERARLCFARAEVFAPLNGLLEGNSPKPVTSTILEIARFRREAQENIVQASTLIAECGYHRRDGAIAELETVLTESRRFADLPPRV